MMADNSSARRNGDSIIARLVCNPALGASRRSAAAGSALHEPGMPAENFFLIQKGQVRLYELSADGSRRLRDILGPGEWFGAEALAALSCYGCQARAHSPTTVYILAAQRLLAALARQPEAGLELVRQLAVKLNVAAEDAGHMVFDDCRRRLIKAMLKFGHSAAARMVDGMVVLHMTHEQLAQAIGAARETVSLVINELRRQKLVHTSRNRLSFEFPALNRCLADPHPSRSSTIFS
jgi:CRP-like cAMP-binding protein